MELCWWLLRVSGLDDDDNEDDENDHDDDGDGDGGCSNSGGQQPAR